MPKVVNKQSKSDLTPRRARPDLRWRAEDAAAWQAVEGIWVDRRLDAVVYQRHVRRDRPSPKR